MEKKKPVRAVDLLYLLFRTSSQELPFDKTFGEWYLFLNIERGIKTSANKDHKWFRICGVRVQSKNNIQFDSEVEPLFLRSTTNEGAPPEAIPHQPHPHATIHGCQLNKKGSVWLNVNRSMEPNIRDYIRTSVLNETNYFCLEKDPKFLGEFLYYLSEGGASIDISEAGS